MEIEEIIETFENLFDQGCFDWDNIPEDKRLSSNNLCGILYLQKLFEKANQPTKNIVIGADRDVVFLSTLQDLAEIGITKEDVEYLGNCGLHIEEDHCFAMFV